MTNDNGPSGSARLKQEAAVLGRALTKALAGLPAALAEIVTLSPVALGIALIALGAWWYEHGAHLRQAGELHELKQQTAANISQLRAQAAAAVREANHGRAQRIVELEDRKSTRLNSSHSQISYAVFCLKKKKKKTNINKIVHVKPNLFSIVETLEYL